MDINPVVDHLRAGVAGIRQFGAVADLAAADEARLVAPALFVMPVAEQVADDDFDGDTVLRATFMVVTVVANRRDAAGGAALSDLEAVRLATRGALDSLVLPFAQVPPRFVRGSLLRFSDAALWWGDDFEVDIF